MQNYPDQLVFGGNEQYKVDRLYMQARLQVGEKWDSQQQSVYIEFLDTDGQKVFEIVPASQAVEGAESGQRKIKYCGSCSLVDSHGKQIVVIEPRRSRPRQIKIKTPSGQRVLDAERRLIGGSRGHVGGVELTYDIATRFNLFRDCEEGMPFANPTYQFTHADRETPLGMGCLLPYDEASNAPTAVAASYQIDIFGGSDAALCALFAYLLHWAELVNLAHHVRKFDRLAGSGQHGNFATVSSKRRDRENAELCIEGPEGLHGFKDAVVRGWKGEAKCGLDMIGGPFIVHLRDLLHSSTTKSSYSADAAAAMEEE